MIAKHKILPRTKKQENDTNELPKDVSLHARICLECPYPKPNCSDKVCKHFIKRNEDNNGN